MIYVKFYNFPELILKIEDSELGRNYTQLVKLNYQKTFPIYRDSLKYTKEYMLDLVEEAKKTLGWDWKREEYLIDTTALLHKDLERLLGKVGFSNITEDKDNLLHELHYCLHLIQNSTNVQERKSWLQIEWYNNDGFNLPEDFIFSTDMHFGDVKLQNPFVGHGPLQIYLEKDFTNIAQTCKFHNYVKPGINIGIASHHPTVPHNLIIEKFKHYAPDFVTLHGEDKIRHYTGYPIIGHVLNLDILEEVKVSATLELEYLRFDE